MKKLMIAAAASIAAVGAFAVESANVVGYASQTYVGGKWLICATPFQNTTGQSFKLNDLVSGFTTTDSVVDTSDNMRLNNPYIQIQNRDNSGALTVGTMDWYWCADAFLDEEGNVTGPAWADGDGCAAGGFYHPDVTIAPGTAFWFKDPASEVAMTLTIAGQVLGADTTPITPTRDKWNLICNPYPIELALNSDKITWSGITAATVDTSDNMRSNNAYIQIQNRDANGVITVGTMDWYWCTDAFLDEEGNVTGPAWADGDGCAAGGPYNPNVTIPVGAGFWFKDPSSDVTITWAK